MQQETIDYYIHLGETAPGTVANRTPPQPATGPATFGVDDDHPFSVIQRMIELKNQGKNKEADELYAQHRSRIRDQKAWKIRRPRPEADDSTRVEKTVTGAPGRLTPEAEAAWASLQLANGTGEMRQPEKDRRIDQGQNAGAPGRGPSSIDWTRLPPDKQQERLARTTHQDDRDYWQSRSAPRPEVDRLSAAAHPERSSSAI